MNYVWYHIKNDPKYWVKIVIIPAILVVALLDFLSHMFKPPGFFNLWFFMISLGVSILLVIAYAVYLYITPRKEKKTLTDQAHYERKREREFREIIQENPDFQTYCFTCRHFNQEIKACRLDIKNPRARAMSLNDRYRYCMYWESLN